MSRKNIFNILEESINTQYQIRKINDLLNETSINEFTLENYVDAYGISNWKARKRYTSCSEMRSLLRITSYDINHKVSPEQVLYFLEYVANLIWLYKEKLYDNNDRVEHELIYLEENTYSLIEDLGFEVRLYKDEEKVILAEKDAAAMAAAEVSVPDISKAIIEYNHFTMKGNLAGKRHILYLLGHKFEPIRKDVAQINSSLSDNIAFMLNKMNIRHNNKEGQCSSFLSSISDSDLEAWYDETYQMLLLAILTIDNISRNKKISELKQLVENNKV